MQVGNQKVRLDLHDIEAIAPKDEETGEFIELTLCDSRDVIEVAQEFMSEEELKALAGNEDKVREALSELGQKIMSMECPDWRDMLGESIREVMIIEE